MKRNYKYTRNIAGNRLCLALAVGTALSLTACTKNFDKYNTDPNKLSAAQSSSIASTAFGPMEQAIYSNYQRAQNLSADGYSGYMQAGIAFSGDHNNLTYVMTDGWNSTGFNDQYSLVMSPVHALATTTNLKTANPEMWAVALLVEVEAMDRVTDRFGPIPYTKVGTSLTSAVYDDQQTVYQTFFKQIDTAETNLKAYISANAKGATSLGSSDYIYNGNYIEWLKFANSLRLRLAMRLSKVDAATAQQQAQKALTDQGGLLTTPADDAAIAQTGGRENDLHMISGDWDNTNMSAAIGSYLIGYNDPRLPVYFEPAQAGAGAAAGQWQGIRAGSIIGANQSTYSVFANLNTSQTFQFSTPQLIMTAAEVWFLRAEAALRGWSSESVQTDYETGISTSMSQWNVAIGSYLSDATSTEANFTDPLNPANDATALSTITIKWDPSATKEQQLERIITQKWLAIFPDGQEAWADYRRTGYPKLFTVANNFSGGTIDTQIQIRRLPYPSTEYTTNGPAVKQAVTMLGGADNGGTRLWWDVNKPNF